MINKACAGEIDYILTKSLSRLSRNVLDTLEPVGLHDIIIVYSTHVEAVLRLMPGLPKKLRLRL